MFKTTGISAIMKVLMTDTFKVQIGEFEGPLDMLLAMIEKRKLHISDVSLAQVTDDYISYINEKSLPKRDLANFIVVASTLMLIKSLALLPTLETTEEENQDIQELKRRLKIYQIHQNNAKKIQALLQGPSAFSRQPSKMKNIIFSPTEEVTTNNILNSIKELVKSFPVKEVLPQVVVKKIISLEEAVMNLTRRVERSLKLSFKEFSSGQEKANIIVSFLGMLELVKNGIIDAKQEALFSDIDIENSNAQVPKYN